MSNVTAMTAGWSGGDVAESPVRVAHPTTDQLVVSCRAGLLIVKARRKRRAARRGACGLRPVPALAPTQCVRLDRQSAPALSLSEASGRRRARPPADRLSGQH